LQAHVSPSDARQVLEFFRIRNVSSPGTASDGFPEKVIHGTRDPEMTQKETVRETAVFDGWN
jgi:hypothetical protein